MKFIEIEGKRINPRHIWDIEVKTLTTIFVVNIYTPRGKFYRSFKEKDEAWAYVSEIMNCW
jgi:hypothetical protein